MTFKRAVGHLLGVVAIALGLAVRCAAVAAIKMYITSTALVDQDLPIVDVLGTRRQAVKAGAPKALEASRSWV